MDSPKHGAAGFTVMFDQLNSRLQFAFGRNRRISKLMSFYRILTFFDFRGTEKQGVTLEPIEVSPQYNDNWRRSKSEILNSDRSGEQVSESRLLWLAARRSDLSHPTDSNLIISFVKNLRSSRRTKIKKERRYWAIPGTIPETPYELKGASWTENAHFMRVSI